MKTYDRSDLKLGIIEVVLDIVSAYRFWVQKFKGQGHRVIIPSFPSFWDPSIYSERLKIENLYWYTYCTQQVLATMTNYPQTTLGRVTWPKIKIWDPSKTTLSKFCTLLIDYVQHVVCRWKTYQLGRLYIFEQLYVETSHLVNTSKTTSISHRKTNYPVRWAWSWSRDTGKRRKSRRWFVTPDSAHSFCTVSAKKAKRF